MSSTFLRDTDVISRFGGDEFIVIALANQTDSEILASKFLKHFNHANRARGSIVELGQDLGCSIGCYSKIPDHHESLDDFFKMADKALYQAKEKGKNTFIIL